MRAHSRARTTMRCGLWPAALLVGAVIGCTMADDGARDERAADAGGKEIVGYFTQWGIYGRDYHVKDIETSGAAEKLTIINYAFGHVKDGECVMLTQQGVMDAYADYQKAYPAADSVDGEADSWDQPLRGNFNQLRKLKERHPHLEVLISLGGWTWSEDFSDAALTAESRRRVVSSCIDLYIRGNLPHDAGTNTGGEGVAAGIFDGIDIDWEYPAAPGHPHNTYRPQDTRNFTLLLEEFRRQLDEIDPDLKLTVATGAGVDKYEKLELDQIHEHLDYVNIMTYDMHGAWEDVTNFPAPLYGSASDPSPYPASEYNVDSAVQAYIDGGVPPEKIIMGVPFYGRGWTGVNDADDGLYQPASGGAPGTYETGIEDYDVLKELDYPTFRDPETGAMWIFDGNTFWSYDDPEVLREKVAYAKAEGLGGVMAWSLDGDDGTLMSTLHEELNGGVTPEPDPGEDPDTDPDGDPDSDPDGDPDSDPDGDPDSDPGTDPDSPTDGGDCGGVEAYQEGAAYDGGDVVQNLGDRYRCDVGGWCGQAAWAYEPGAGMHWTMAWTYLDACADGGGDTPEDPPTTPNPPRDPEPGEPQPDPGTGAGLPERLLVGYWHNFDNGSTSLRLGEVFGDWDVVNVAFAVPTTVGGAEMAFTPSPDVTGEAEFRADVQLLQSRGQTVLLSIGGANGRVELASAADADAFASSLIAIIEDYGFDGLDIDLEGSSVSLASGDTDFRNPTSPRIVHLIDATRQILDHFGPDFVLSMAPETAFVQGGHSVYAGVYGAYLPVIDALRDRLSYIHVQHYNSGCMIGLDGACHAQGTADFHVAMAEMLLQGFTVAGGATFPPLEPEQVVIGLPASPSAAGGGYTAPAEVHRALDYLLFGESFGGAYSLRDGDGYRELRGLMTWSINWDVAHGHEFSNAHRPYLDNL